MSRRANVEQKKTALATLTALALPISDEKKEEWASEISNYGTPKAEYIQKLAGLNETDMKAEMKHMIWLSAYANNNPRSDYHWQCDATYDIGEIKFPGLYAQAHKEVVRENR